MLSRFLFCLVGGKFVRYHDVFDRYVASTVVLRTDSLAKIAANLRFIYRNIFGRGTSTAVESLSFLFWLFPLPRRSVLYPEERKLNQLRAFLVQPCSIWIWRKRFSFLLLPFSIFLHNFFISFIHLIWLIPPLDLDTQAVPPCRPSRVPSLSTRASRKQARPPSPTAAPGMTSAWSTFVYSLLYAKGDTLLWVSLLQPKGCVIARL